MLSVSHKGLKEIISAAPERKILIVFGVYNGNANMFNILTIGNKMSTMGMVKKITNIFCKKNSEMGKTMFVYIRI